MFSLYFVSFFFCIIGVKSIINLLQCYLGTLANFFDLQIELMNMLLE